MEQKFKKRKGEPNLPIIYIYLCIYINRCIQKKKVDSCHYVGQTETSWPSKLKPAQNIVLKDPLLQD